MRTKKPQKRPQNPCFSSGPCAKRPEWNLQNLKHAPLGRSHRSQQGAALLKRAIHETRSLLDIPQQYRIAITPASDTGAMEMALWSLLGERGVDVLDWDSFGSDWAHDITEELAIKDARIFKTDYGSIPNLQEADFSRDVVFLWNGTTSGTRVPNGEWIDPKRQGLTICDATSAVFAQEIPWDKIDVATFSWQKALGGEGAHGMLVLSPRAVQRLESFKPPRPMPKIFRMTKGGKINSQFFEGQVINTPSLLCVEDYLDALAWAKKIGGLPALMNRVQKNYDAISDWVEKTDWVSFLCPDPDYQSNTSVCLKIKEPSFDALPPEEQRLFVKKISAILEKEAVAFDIDGYRAAPPGLRIWAGATIERQSLLDLFPWIEWAYTQAKN